jgi:hypothetical protein
MPYANPKDRKKQKNPPVGSKAHKARMERQRARRAFDKKHTGKVTTKSPKRDGKDISHKKALVNGGSNKDGTFLESPSDNRARNYKKKKK